MEAEQVLHHNQPSSNETCNLKQQFSPSNKSEGITVITQPQSDSFKNIISIHKELLQTYADIYNISINYTYSNSTDNSRITSSLPCAQYGVNIIKRYNINYFLKKLTNINQYFPQSRDTSTEAKVIFGELEKIILTDLQLILSMYNYLKNFTKNLPLQLPLLKFVYDIRNSFRTYRNDKKILAEFFDIFHVKNEEGVRFFHINLMYKDNNFG